MKFFCGVDIEIRIDSQNNARGRNFNPFQRLHSERKDLKENSAFWSNYFRMHFVCLECVIGCILLCHWFNLIQYRIQNILTPVSMKWLNLSMSYPRLSESNTLGARWTRQCGAWRATIFTYVFYIRQWHSEIEILLPSNDWIKCFLLDPNRIFS